MENDYNDDIGKAYRAVLGREPDKEGHAFYTALNLPYKLLCINLGNSTEAQNSRFSARVAKHFNWPMAQIFVARNIKTLYCPIGKNANTLGKRLIVELSDVGKKNQILNGDVHNLCDTQNTGIQLSDFDHQEVSKILNDESYLKFAILRDPMARLISAYWEKFVVNRLTEGNLWHTLSVVEDVQKRSGKTKPDPELGISFIEFVRFITSCAPASLDAHWRPQYMYLQGVRYNALFDQSNLIPLYHELSERAGRKIRQTKINVSNSGKGKKVDGAFSLLPNKLESIGSVDKSSFCNDEIEDLARSYFSLDYTLHQTCQSTG